jgi:hypothetical protein
MTNRCPDCGADIALVGIRHLCRPHRAAEEGAGLSARAQPAPLSSESLDDAAPSGTSTSPRKRTRKLPKARAARSRVKPGRVKAGRSTKPWKAVMGKVLKIADALRKTGRPRLEDRGKTLTATKPWKKAKMSRATWYRRQAEKRG